MTRIERELDSGPEHRRHEDPKTKGQVQNAKHDDTMTAMTRRKAGPMDGLRCSFCQKRQNDVRKLIAGTSVNICDECVGVCEEIIADDTRISGTALVDGRLTATSPLMPAAAAAVVCALCRMPTTARGWRPHPQSTRIVPGLHQGN